MPEEIPRPLMRRFAREQRANAVRAEKLIWRAVRNRILRLPNALVAPEGIVAELSGETGVRYAPTHDKVTVGVAHAFPWVDGSEMRRLLRGSEPLRSSKIRGAAHGGLAVAPVLHAEPLDEVICIASLLAVPEHAVTLGISNTTNVRVADRVAVRTPVRWVRALELLKSRDYAAFEPHEFKDAHRARRGTLSLAVGTEGNNHGDWIVCHWAEQVDICDGAVAESHCDVLVEHNIDGQLEERCGELRACCKRSRTWLESA